MKEAYEFILNNLKNKDSVVIGVSGGPDSMSLLYLVLEVRKKINIEIICAHVNHNVRKESSDELIFIQDYCNKNKIIFESIVIEKYGDNNFQSEARNKRYSFFKDMLEKYRAKYLFTAHHADDLMETILMRIVRGSTLKGYSGFSRISQDNRAKPLINVTKEEIYNYIKKNKIKYVIDSSNEKETYTRNRFRKNIIPFLKKEDEYVHEKFYKFSKLLLEYNEYVDKHVEESLKKVYKNNTLNIEEFLKLKHIIQMRIIYYILEKIYKDNLILINDIHAESILKLVKSNKANSKINLPNNIVAIKSYNNLMLSLVTEPSDYKMEIKKSINLPNGKKIEKITETNKDDNFICRLDSKEIKIPLYVRNKKTGDKMNIKGMSGSKKIVDIFINDKIAVTERKKWPVVIDNDDNIVWLPGLKKSKFCKTKEENYDIILRYY